jgi:hypothetical protein
VSETARESRSTPCPTESRMPRHRSAASPQWKCAQDRSGASDTARGRRAWPGFTSAFCHDAFSLLSECGSPINTVAFISRRR